MFEKILVPTDGSADSAKALEYARNLAEKFNSDVTLIHIVQQYQPHIYEIISVDTCIIPPTIIEGLEEVGQAILEKAKEHFEGFKGKLETRLEFGQASERIVAIAAEEKFSAIVMGSRGLNGFKGLLLGSVSNQVAQYAPCPIIIIKDKPPAKEKTKK